MVLPQERSQECKVRMQSVDTFALLHPCTLTRYDRLMCRPHGALSLKGEPKPGDLVFFVGTYDTPGVSHVGIYVGNSVMLHCGDPISYTNLNSSYWQQHFYCYGRLP